MISLVIMIIVLCIVMADNADVVRSMRKEQQLDIEIASKQVTSLLIEKRALLEYIHGLPKKFWPKREVGNSG